MPFMSLCGHGSQDANLSTIRNIITSNLIILYFFLLNNIYSVNFGDDFNVIVLQRLVKKIGQIPFFPEPAFTVISIKKTKQNKTLSISFSKEIYPATEVSSTQSLKF